MLYAEIFPYIEKEGIYYSTNCISYNIQLFRLNDEVPKDGYPFLSMKQNAKLELKMAGNTIILNYDGKQFTFSENENYNEALNLVKSVFKNGNVSIQDDSGKKIEKLIPTNKYHIRVEMLATFFPIKR